MRDGREGRRQEEEALSPSQRDGCPPWQSINQHPCTQRGDVCIQTSYRTAVCVPLSVTRMTFLFTSCRLVCWQMEFFFLRLDFFHRDKIWTETSFTPLGEILAIRSKPIQTHLVLQMSASRLRNNKRRRQTHSQDILKLSVQYESQSKKKERGKLSIGFMDTGHSAAVQTDYGEGERDDSVCQDSHLQTSRSASQ